MIVKNEEAVLSRCLTSVKNAVDEIIIVDTGSTDATKKIAKEFTDKVYDFKWSDDFSAARNYAFSKASKEYLMWLDADDIISDKDLAKLIELKNTADNIDVFYLKYNVAFDENGNAVFSYFRERIVKNCKDAVWTDPVHEVIIPFGTSQYCDIAITHKKEKASVPKRNLKIYEKELSLDKKFSARMKYYYARELMYNEDFEKASKAFEAFLDDITGWHENKISACRDLYRCKKKLNPPVEDIFILYKSFEYAPPRAEILCEIGEYFFNRRQYLTAEFWYLSALNCKIDQSNLGFIEHDYYNFFPLMQLCVICYRTGRLELAAKYNEKAGALKPDSPQYKFNKKFFAN